MNIQCRNGDLNSQNDAKCNTICKILTIKIYNLHIVLDLKPIRSISFKLNLISGFHYAYPQKPVIRTIASRITPKRDSDVCTYRSWKMPQICVIFIFPEPLLLWKNYRISRKFFVVLKIKWRSEMFTRDNNQQTSVAWLISWTCDKIQAKIYRACIIQVRERDRERDIKWFYR